MTPLATIRLQLHSGFTLAQAAEQLPYFKALGVSHLYLSPVTCARAGSTHGYDVIDHRRVNPELGGGDALRMLAQRARELGMGLILDIVPNHMAAHPDNPWWHSVLRDGQTSPYADWFDIQWDAGAPEFRGKVLLPVLPEPYATALAHGVINLVFQEDDFVIQVSGLHLPVAAGTLGPAGKFSVEERLAAHDSATPEGRRALHELLQRQHYRLAWWQCAAEQINWRRFFEISDLVGVCVERDDVFQAVHDLPLRLYEQGLIDGLRIDHVDGLAQPLAYCSRLARALRGRMMRRPGSLSGQPPWLLVEKILARNEFLDERWAVDGTTGYDFMEMVNGVLHDPRGECRLTSVWHRVARDMRPLDQWKREARERMVSHHFCAEREALLDIFSQLTGSDIKHHDMTRQSLGRALDGMLIEFGVYRSYASLEQRSSTDLQYLKHARDHARRTLEINRDVSAVRALEFLSDCLLGRTRKVTEADTSAPRETQETGRDRDPAAAGRGDALRPPRKRALLALAMRRFQQLTPPLAAKALEDTVFYRYGRLLSRNEVGSDPARFSISAEEFLAWNVHRVRHASRSMNATATHDHKRGEDMRARLAVLSEVPDAWDDISTRCLAALGQHSTINAGIPAAQCYMLLQTIVGAWPIGLRTDDEAGMAAFVDRLQAWQLKALREAKQQTSWFWPDEAIEQAQADRLEFLLCDPDSESCRLLSEFAAAIAPAGALNSLAMAVLRCTLPGVPDLYQGTEVWDFSLVDPDNRRDVDFSRRQALLGAIQDERHALSSSQLLSRWTDGAVKQAVIWRCLQLRQSRPDLFLHGSFEPLAVYGKGAVHVLAFMRRTADESVLVLVSRLACKAADKGELFPELPLIPPGFWQDTCIQIPRGCRKLHWLDVLSGKSREAAGGSLQIGSVLTCLPVAVLVAP